MHPRLRAGDRAVRAAVLDRHAVDQHPVDGAVALDERRRVDARELAEGVVERLGGQVRVEPRERLRAAAAPGRRRGSRVAALGAGLAGGDLRAVQDRVAEPVEPGEGGVLDDDSVKVGIAELAAGASSRRGEQGPGRPGLTTASHTAPSIDAGE